jgi:hypothetical protein
MPPLFSDAVDGFFDIWRQLLEYWGSLPDVTRMAIALLAAGATVYAATKAEQSGWSAVLLFAAFGIFSYVVFVGYSMVQ